MQILIYIGAFFLIAAIGFIPLLIVYLYDKFLEKRYSKKQYIFIVSVITLLAFLLINLQYLPAPYTPPISNNAFTISFIAQAIVLSLAGSSVLFILISWSRLKLLRRKPTIAQLSRRKKAAKFAVVMTVLILSYEPVKKYMPLHAVSRADQLIENIESYKKERYEYPPSSGISTTYITTPGLLSIKKYYYKKVEDDYYISFPIPTGYCVYDPYDAFKNEHSNYVRHEKVADDWWYYYYN